MLAFLDTEFTDFSTPSLISLALVAEDGREFYAECSDFPLEECNTFVLDEVLPLLGRVPGAQCPRSVVAERLRKWFDALPEPLIVIADFEGDWRLMRELLTDGGKKELPANLGEKQVLGDSILSDPVFDRKKNLKYTLDWPPHHALADARALMAGYRAWRAAMELVWAAKE